MTNNEILKADILDLIFENRNKDYGAYALRRGYNNRLFISLGTALAMVGLFLFLNRTDELNSTSAPSNRMDNEMKITKVILPAEKQKEKDIKKEKIQVEKKVASKKFVSKIEIKPDDKVKEKTPDIASLDSVRISDKTVEGEKDIKTTIIKTKSENIGTTVIPDGNTKQSEFIPVERDPEFPGGRDALNKFLARNLNSPSNLEDGEIKTVRIRFKVDKDGQVKNFEIVTSGGNEFDNEVVRVCKKMPRWIPALQNGTNVPVSYVLPVTFIGAEQ